MDALYWNTYHGISKKMDDLGVPHFKKLLRFAGFFTAPTLQTRRVVGSVCGVGRRLGRKSLQQLALQDVTNLGRQLAPRWKLGNLKMWNRNLGHFRIIHDARISYIPECVARVPVSLWGSGG